MLTLIDLFLLPHSSNLLNILGVDFWSDVGPDSKVVDIMVDPLQVERVSEYLSLHGVQFEVCLVSHGGSWPSLAVICCQDGSLLILGDDRGSTERNRHGE